MKFRVVTNRAGNFLIQKYISDYRGDRYWLTMDNLCYEHKQNAINRCKELDKLHNWKSEVVFECGE